MKFAGGFLDRNRIEADGNSAVLKTFCVVIFAFFLLLPRLIQERRG